ncbi:MULTISPECIES: MBL fold metallo-hydrolase [unclassified Sporosarcina]|uniref:MBL fold metallo-hydrolase n=1 Tax=unclassified Sporosarcina TaxID=2647733 RepID=UPI00203F3A3E|nr:MULTISPECIES: MBL fold metallo-hydrolase [unclassified Sporosarcina]GKV64604.1 putative metallo-hydrolase YqgX [Sporosarcina sp. NCCP-2331]GLB54523.1 putative metallo-hydrolase YqgX [Sporosarcina sp. NCCP-2378]
MKIHIHPLGPIQTNCYVVEDEDKNCLVFDPGDESDALLAELQKLSLKPAAILLTHAHFDHIGAIEAIRQAYDIPVYLHSAEKDWLGNADLNGSGKYPMLPNVVCSPADVLLNNEKSLQVGPFIMGIRYTPGHSPGSISYIFEDEGFAIVGDTLFKGSVGRTDLPGGNTETLLASIHNELLSLDEELVIYPGHGPATTPGIEQDQNPFLHGF